MASASPVSCAGAGSVEVTGADVQAPQYAETPRPSRPSPAPTLAAPLETGDPAATHLSAFSEVLGPLPVHASVDSPKPCRQAALRPFREARRREPAGRRASVSSRRLWRAHNSVVADSQDDPGRPGYRNRGKGIAGSRPSGRSLSGNAIVAPGAQLGAGAPLSWAIAAVRCRERLSGVAYAGPPSHALDVAPIVLDLNATGPLSATGRHQQDAAAFRSATHRRLTHGQLADDRKCVRSTERLSRGS